MLYGLSVADSSPPRGLAAGKHSGNGSDTNNPHGVWSLQYGNNPLLLHYWHSTESAWFWDWSGTTVPSFAFETLAKWNDYQPVIAFTNFGIRSNRFSFAITGDSNTVSIVQACTNLAAPVWTPVATNTLTGGSAYFSDATWSNHPVRFYRVQLP